MYPTPPTQTLEADQLTSLLDGIGGLADSMGLKTRRSRHTGDQTTVYGVSHTGLYQKGLTTKIRFWTRDREAEIRITGTTGNDVETFDVTASLNTPARILQGAIEAALAEIA